MVGLAGNLGLENSLRNDKVDFYPLNKAITVCPTLPFIEKKNGMGLEKQCLGQCHKHGILFHNWPLNRDPGLRPQEDPNDSEYLDPLLDYQYDGFLKVD